MRATAWFRGGRKKDTSSIGLNAADAT